MTLNSLPFRERISQSEIPNNRTQLGNGEVQYCGLKVLDVQHRFPRVVFLRYHLIVDYEVQIHYNVVSRDVFLGGHPLRSFPNAYLNSRINERNQDVESRP